MGNTAEIKGKQISTLFSNAIDGLNETVGEKLPEGSSCAVDLEIKFNSVELEEKGFRLLWTNSKSKKATMEIRLATRIYIEGKQST